MGGDHSTAQSILNLRVSKCGRPIMRFAKPRRASPEDVTDPVDWNAVAVSNNQWSEALKDPEAAYATWAANAEDWLVKSKVLQQHQPEKSLAESPKLVSGAHRMGTLQSLIRVSKRDNFEDSCGDWKKLVSCNFKGALSPPP
eukprot:s2526_g2.t1